MEGKEREEGGLTTILGPAGENEKSCDNVKYMKTLLVNTWRPRRYSDQETENYKKRQSKESQRKRERRRQNKEEDLRSDFKLYSHRKKK